MTYAPQQQQQQYTGDPAGGILLSEELEIFISCRNLPKLDVSSPSDPFVVISQKKDNKSAQYRELAKTEVVNDNPNPEFAKQIKISYKFEEVQVLRLDVYDADSSNVSRLSDHDYIGFCEFVLGDLVTANNQKLAMKLKNRKTLKPLSVKSLPVICVVRCEEVAKTNDEVLFHFAAQKLPKMDWGFAKIDAYLQIYREASDGGWMSVHQTEVVKNNYAPVWKPLNISLQRLCNGDYSRQILFKCWDWNKNAKPDYACEMVTSLQELSDLQSKPFKQKKKGKYTKKKCGTLLIRKVEIVQRFGFLQYIMGGMQVQLIIAVDFTGSNGNPKDASSLHFVGAPKFESPYMRAIRSVGRVLEPYDSDGQIGAFGFGANLNPYGARQISHCFNLSLDPSRDELPGIEGVLQAYHQCVQRVQLAGPTYFNEIVGSAAGCAASVVNSQREQNYVILLIITDGIINDMQKTVDSVVNATELPLSIIIVGVGNADFSSMDRLDADDTPLRSSQGRVMKRDIVQFVPFNKFNGQAISCLAKEVLEEVPEQITGYMGLNKLSPLAKNHGLMKQQSTMANIYQGPSTLVRANTQNNVIYPNLNNNQPVAAHRAMANSGAIGKPVNPYYAQQQQQQPPPQQQQQQIYGNPNLAQTQVHIVAPVNVYGQQQAMTQYAFNPNMNNNNNNNVNPTAPTF